MDKQELKKKLAEWRGFTFKPFAPQYATPEEPDPEFVYAPDGNISGCPNFPESLDACFKWLVPKVLEEYNIEYYNFKQLSDEQGTWYYAETNIWRKGSTKHGFEVLHDEHIAKNFQQGSDLNKITALALCLAVEKLIDGEGK